MSKQVYNPFEDTDIKTPVFKEDGKPLILPAHIVGIEVKEIHSKKTGDDMQVINFLYEVSSQVEKIGDIPIFPEDEEGNYIYDKAPTEHKPATLLEEKKFRSSGSATMWRNLSKGSGGMNRNYIKGCKALGVEVKQEKIDYDGKKVSVDVIPEPTEENFLGLPVFIVLGIDSWKNNRGVVINSTKAVRSIQNENGDKKQVLENQLSSDTSSNGSAPSGGGEEDPFDSIPF